MNAGWVKQIKNVQKHGVCVFYPNFMPARFNLSNVKFGGSDEAHPDYSLIFQGKGKNTITIESACEGFGDGPDGYKNLKGRCEAFGPFKINVLKPHSDGNNTSENYYISDWLESKKKTSVIAKRFYNLYGTGLTDKEAVAIVESLAPLKN